MGLTLRNSHLSQPHSSHGLTSFTSHSIQPRISQIHFTPHHTSHLTPHNSSQVERTLANQARTPACQEQTQPARKRLLPARKAKKKWSNCEEMPACQKNSGMGPRCTPCALFLVDLSPGTCFLTSHISKTLQNPGPSTKSQVADPGTMSQDVPRSQCSRSQALGPGCQVPDWRSQVPGTTC